MPRTSADLTRHEDPKLVAGEFRRWLGSGRVQAESGAYCAWRDAGASSLAFEYPEITGYALTWLAREDVREHEVAAGRRAADWLVDRLAANDRSARSGWEHGAVYTFDLGMIAAGLMSFGSLVGESSYVEHGRDVARSLAGYLDEMGEIPALAPEGPVSSRPGEWSTDGRVHLVKCAQALLLADERDAALALSRQATDAQAADGHFTTQPGDEFVMLHPHLYAVEGLWMLAEAEDRGDLRDHARRATEWAWRHQLPSGGMPRWASASSSGPEQLDTTSQAVRAAILLELEPPGLQRATHRLAELARADADHGSALIYRPEDVADHLNTWVTMFAAQALEVVAEGPQAVRWKELV